MFISHLWLLFFRYLEKLFEEERNENKVRNSRGVTTSQLPQNKERKVEDDFDFDLVFVR